MQSATASPVENYPNPDDAERGFVRSEMSAVERVLSRIHVEGLATGPLFCEWGSGAGEVCSLAEAHGFTPYGIEIQGPLVEASRAMATEQGLTAVFAEGTFLLPGDEDLVDSETRTELSFNNLAWTELGLAPADCNVVFAYPWPGEEAFFDRVFARHASPGALLVTFHDWHRVLVQRKDSEHEALTTLGWM